MSAPRSNSAPETVTIPRIELATQGALLALADRVLGLVMHAGPHGEMALLDLERAYILARAAIRNEIDSRPVAHHEIPVIMRRSSRARRASIGGIAS